MIQLRCFDKGEIFFLKSILSQGDTITLLLEWLKQENSCFKSTRKPQGLTRKQKHRLMLLVEMQNGTANLESIVLNSHKVQNIYCMIQQSHSLVFTLRAKVLSQRLFCPLRHFLTTGQEGAGGRLLLLSSG